MYGGVWLCDCRRACVRVCRLCVHVVHVSSHACVCMLRAYGHSSRMRAYLCVGWLWMCHACFVVSVCCFAVMPSSSTVSYIVVSLDFDRTLLARVTAIVWVLCLRTTESFERFKNLAKDSVDLLSCCWWWCSIFVLWLLLLLNTQLLIIKCFE